MRNLSIIATILQQKGWLVTCSKTIWPISASLRYPIQPTGAPLSTVAANNSEAEDTSKSSAVYYNIRAHNLPDIHVGSHVAVQNPQSHFSDINGRVAEIGPHRRYYIETTDGRVLVRNRRFLSQPQYPMDLNLIQPQILLHLELLKLNTDPHSIRRLIEDKHWT